MPSDDALMTEAEIFVLLGVSQRTVRRRRTDGTRPPALRVARTARCRCGAGEAWLDHRDSKPGQR